MNVIAITLNRNTSNVSGLICELTISLNIRIHLYDRLALPFRHPLGIVATAIYTKAKSRVSLANCVCRCEPTMRRSVANLSVDKKR